LNVKKSHFYNWTLLGYDYGKPPRDRRRAMSEELTHHAMLVAWGEFAQQIGLVDKIQAVEWHQKTVTHTPQAKVIEFLVAILGGLEHLKDLRGAAHPLVKDTAVAQAWGRAGWADYRASVAA